MQSEHPSAAPRVAVARTLARLAVVALAVLCGACRDASAPTDPTDPTDPAAQSVPPAQTKPLAPVPDGPKRRNVVVFVIDTCRADHCSVMGYERPTTPGLEALARRGARFLDAWSPACWTAPSHSSMFTGLLPTTHGFMTDNRMYLPAHFDTLAEILQREGWATACFTENNFISSAFGLTQGFDEVHATYLLPDTEHRSGRDQALAGDWALARVKEGRPFFLFVNVLDPHAPYTPCEPWRSRFMPDATKREERIANSMKMPRSLVMRFGDLEITERELEVIHQAYDGEVASADDAVSSLVRRLDEAGVLDDTVFVATSDHGENLGDHRFFDHVGSLHRAVLHVPLVIRAKGVFDDGRAVNDVVRLIDLFPTILELCDLKVPKGTEGRSLLRDLPGRPALAAIGPPETSRQQMAEIVGEDAVVEMLSGCRSVYDGTHHLIVFEDGRTELYDVSKDPQELVDLSSALDDVVERLRPLLLPYTPK